MIREWMACLVKALLAPQAGLFERCDTHEISYRIAEGSTQVAQWEELLQFMGKLIGKAVFDRIPLNLCFSRVLYKVILARPLELADINFLDECVLHLSTVLNSSTTPSSTSRSVTWIRKD